MDGRRTSGRTPAAVRRPNAPAAFGIVVAGCAALLVVATALPAAASVTGRVAGQVVSKSTGRPVAGATVTLPDYGVTTTSGSDGSFAFTTHLSTSYPYRLIPVVITSAGFGRWTITGVPLVPNDTLLLNAELSSRDFTHPVFTAPGVRADQGRTASPLSTYTFTCTGWPSQIVPPKTISVYLTAQKKAQQYDYAFYLSHVLPKEWIPTWDADSLGAGAIAVKNYSWYRTRPGHAYSGGSGCADIVDSSADQVFDPTYSYGKTDQAVFATLGSILWRGGGIFITQYFAGSTSDPCAPVTGTYAGRMSQWGTENCAEEGKLWPDIVETFYSTTSNPTLWTYLYNLILDPTVEDADTYAWLHTSGTTVTRTEGGAYGGSWYFTLSTSSASTLYEVRPFNGTSSTVYHLKVALKCGSPNTTNCPITLKVISNAADGSVMVQSRLINENPDGKWRLYYFDPPASGIGHTAVQVNIVTKRTIGVDNLTLTSPFGGV